MRYFTVVIIAVVQQLMIVNGGVAQSKKLTLLLDNVTTTPDAASEGVYKYLDNELFYLNSISREIKVFDYKTGETLRSIPLGKNGPDFVGPEPYTFQLISKDSILVYSNFFNYQISLINGEGRVLSKYETIAKNKTGEEMVNGILADGPSNMVVQNHKIYALKTILMKEPLLDYSPLVEIDLRSKEVKVLDEPKQYNSGMYERIINIMQIIQGDIVYNDKRGALVLSYPLDHSVYVSDDGFRSMRKIPVKTKYFDEFKLMSRPSKELAPSQVTEQGLNVLRLSGQYLELHYDPYRSLYYRVARIPYTEKVYKEYKSGVRSRLPPRLHSVMVLDEDFNILSEKTYMVKDYMFRSGVFVGPEGLWVLKPLGNNEDEMIFELLDLDY
ncbi:MULTISPECIES: DUF4221 family protein [Roseivirga]|uniref:6-bladed beta-propeller n=1 Tax=Roseivirga echinicomitans TaxID=296218 RepID=A0A150X0Y1_9BACT|nr:MULTISPECIES: DUF4221 family protein [Roseivirga]KYG72336.1 hypothetical protein AWN68_11235 [Roseivirga echinicomitans]